MTFARLAVRRYLLLADTIRRIMPIAGVLLPGSGVIIMLNCIFEGDYDLMLLGFHVFVTPAYMLLALIPATILESVGSGRADTEDHADVVEELTDLRESLVKRQQHLAVREARAAIVRRRKRGRARDDYAPDEFEIKRYELRDLERDYRSTWRALTRQGFNVTHLSPPKRLTRAEALELIEQREAEHELDEYLGTPTPL